MPSTPPQTRQKLDFESPDDRQARLGKLLSGVAAGSLSSSASATTIPPFQPIREGPYHIPESDALKRARAFLPLFQTSNTDLLSRHAENPESVNIENTEGEEKVIAMDLGLGVFDMPDGEGKEGLGPVVDVKRRTKGKGKGKVKGDGAGIASKEGDAEDDDDMEETSDNETEEKSSDESDTTSKGSDSGTGEGDRGIQELKTIRHEKGFGE